jgi:hypothetical protein
MRSKPTTLRSPGRVILAPRLVLVMLAAAPAAISAASPTAFGLTHVNPFQAHNAPMSGNRAAHRAANGNERLNRVGIDTTRTKGET